MCAVYRAEQTTLQHNMERFSRCQTNICLSVSIVAEALMIRPYLTTPSAQLRPLMLARVPS